MRCALIFSLLVLVTLAVCDQSRPELVKSRPEGAMYLIQLLHPPTTLENDLEITNGIPVDYPDEKENNKFLLALAQHDGPKEIREKRSPWKKPYGGGGKTYGGSSNCGGSCNHCGHSPCGGGYNSGGGAHASASAESYAHYF